MPLAGVPPPPPLCAWPVFESLLPHAASAVAISPAGPGRAGVGAGAATPRGAGLPRPRRSAGRRGTTREGGEPRVGRLLPLGVVPLQPLDRVVDGIQVRLTRGSRVAVLQPTRI